MFRLISILFIVLILGLLSVVALKGVGDGSNPCQLTGTGQSGSGPATTLDPTITQSMPAGCQ